MIKSDVNFYFLRLTNYIVCNDIMIKDIVENENHKRNISIMMVVTPVLLMLSKNPVFLKTFPIIHFKILFFNKDTFFAQTQG